MDSLRILIVQETNWLDRNVIHQHHLAERLAQRGHDVWVIDYDILWQERTERHFWLSRQIFPATNRVVDGVNIDVIRPATFQAPLLCHVSWTISSLVELKRWVDRKRPNVIIGLTLTNSYLMGKMLNRWGIPYISMVLEPYYSMVSQQWLWPLSQMVERQALRCADEVVVFTPQMKVYVTQMSATPHKVNLLKTGVSLDVFKPGLDGSSQRKKLGLKAEDWVLFFMGWLYDFSGLDKIVKGIYQDPKLLNGARLLIVGDGDIYDELNQMVTDHNLKEQVILTGRRPYSEIPTLLAAADVCLMPSLENETTSEIVPMKIYEYLASGKPVVASRLPGLVAEFGSDSGIIYSDGPLDALDKAIDLKAQPEEVERLSQAGRDTAVQNADWKKITDQFEQLLLNSASTNGSLA